MKFRECFARPGLVLKNNHEINILLSEEGGQWYYRYRKSNGNWRTSVSKYYPMVWHDWVLTPSSCFEIYKELLK